MKWCYKLLAVVCLLQSCKSSTNGNAKYKDFTTQSFYNYYTGQLHASISAGGKHYYYVMAPKFCSSCFGYYADVLMKHCGNDSITIVSGRKNIEYLRTNYPSVKADWQIVADEALLDKQYFTRSMQAFGYSTNGMITQFQIINKGNIDHYLNAAKQ